MYDRIIKGGTVVDGTGAAPFIADVAIRDGLIVEVGHITAAARETVALSRTAPTQSAVRMGGIERNG